MSVGTVLLLHVQGAYQLTYTTLFTVENVLYIAISLELFQYLLDVKQLAH